MAIPRLLIVEDEAIVAMDIESKLEDSGYLVIGVARSGEDAVRMAYEKSPDLILMDINLQGDMDGVVAAKNIRERRSVPVVFLTALGDRDTLQRAKITGPLGYLLKPFNERDLYAAVEVGLHKHRMDVKRVSAQRHRTKEAVRERTDELAQRHRELAALNAAFQKHLKIRDEEEQDHRNVRSSVRQFLHQVQELAEDLNRQTGENYKVGW